MENDVNPHFVEQEMGQQKFQPNVPRVRREFGEIVSQSDSLFGKKVEIVDIREKDLIIKHPTLGYRLVYQFDEVKLDRNDTDRMEWLNSNPISIDFVEIGSGYPKNVKIQFPNGFFRVRFGRKDDTNRFGTFREAVDALMDGKIK
jgi:hypothetical protein